MEFSLLLMWVLCWAGAAQLPSNPIWTTSEYFRAGNELVITSLTGSSVSPFSSYTFLFSSALPSVPKLGYGIKDYEGYDYLGEQIFEIRRMGLTSASFTVQVQIFGITNVRKLSVSYIAIDPQFPHLLNSFDNVHINYPNLPLVNITAKNSASTTYYYNTVNYTQQAAGYEYDTFTSPLANHKIILFMTYMSITGTNSCSAGATDYRVYLEVSAEVQTADTYLFTVELQINVALAGLGFSQIVFNSENVRASLRYMIVHEKLEVDFSVPNFFPIPSEFIDNFIMGFTSFKTFKSSTVIHFQWDFQVQNGVHGVSIPISVANGSNINCGSQALSTGYFTVFYIRSWLCPNDTNYFDEPTELCIVCPVSGCEVCYNATTCHQCLEGYYLDPDTLLCEECDLAYCERSITMEEADVCECKFTLQHQSLQYLGCNRMELVFTPDPYVSQAALYQKISIDHDNISSYELEKTEDQKVKASIQLKGDLGDPFIRLTYFPGSEITVEYSSVIPALYYTEQQCLAAENMRTFVLAVKIITWIFIVLSLINAKIIGLELGGLLQIAYFSLADQDFFSIYLAPLVALKEMNGLNIIFVKEKGNEALPSQVQHMGMVTVFLNNCNIMVFVLFAELLLATAVFSIGKIAHSKKIIKIGLILLKQGFLTLVIFNCLNFSFSAGVYWEFGNSQAEGLFYAASEIVMYCCLLAVVASLIGFGVTNSKGYGEFKDKFKNGFVCRSYIGVSIVFRVVLGVTMATESTYSQGSLLILLAPLFFFAFVVANLPFKDVAHNYRACLVHVSTLVILLVSNYYRSMKSNTPLPIKSRFYTPAIIELSLILVCIIVSVGVLLRDIYKFFKQISARQNGKVSNESFRNQNNQTTENLQIQVQQ